MSALRPVDPEVQRLREQLKQLPDCAARNLVLERLATVAENLGDLDTAWTARCSTLSSTTAHANPSFTDLFLSLAWCLAMSDHDPDRFKVDGVLWQYKWVVTDAPRHASVPRDVLFRLLEDMDRRFQAAGWGVRAGLHKRLELHMALGEHDKALTAVEAWRSTSRDRGSDCRACEAGTMIDLLADAGRNDEAVREARPIIQGRLSCATVPHSTFGDLLLPLELLGRRAEASTLFDKGRRLVASMTEGAVKIAGPYLMYAALRRDADTVASMLRIRGPQGRALRSDGDRFRWFSCASVAAAVLDRRGTREIECRPLNSGEPPTDRPTADLAREFGEIATVHANRLDQRNGNAAWADRFALLRSAWTDLAEPHSAS